jgi:chromosome segregation protein
MTTRITKLTLQGFKSFNKRISIPFLEGFNVITGPNGSGKTNLVDAICFVIGRSSAKTLRADRLHELIYNGGKEGEPASYASVTLWLDNSDHTFPFEDKEISIKRKINRKGISVFKLNGKTVTKSRILEILSAARIYPDGHNIVQQGDITNIIEMSPEERRKIIDEISGIAEYDEKKERAKRNLEEVEQRLREIEIILSERYSILKKLEEEKNVALEYRKYQKELEILKASLAYSRMMKSQNKLEEIDRKIAEIEKESDKLDKEIKDLEGILKEKEKEAQEISKTMFERSKVSDLAREIEEVKAKILRNKDKIESNNREIERLNKLIEKLKLIKEKRIGYTQGVQAILNLKKPGVFGTISQLIKVPSEYRVAIEVAIGKHLEDIVVDNDRRAVDCINYLKQQKLGRATFLPLNKIKRRDLKPEQRKLLKLPGVVGLASELVKYDPKYSNAVSFVLGSTIVIDNINTAKEIGVGKVRMVTLDGDLVEKSGAMTGGYYSERGLIDSTEQEIEEYEQSKQELYEEINFLEIEIDQLKKRLNELRSLEEEEAKEVVDLEERRERIEKELEEINLKRKEIFEKRLNLQSEINRLKIEKAKVEAERDKYKLELEEYGKVKYIEQEPSVLERNIKEINRKINLLGLINMKAIEEYQNSKKEFDEIKEKYDRIVKEKKAVLEMIKNIELRRKEVFYDCMTKINYHFNEMFRELTGGPASIELEDPSDLESGLVIKASPGGKKLLNIDAMSGGEKVLTALAFLFAIQRFRPAPFYILDEVDAALDKSNSKKVAELLKKLSRKAQFIVITHNDATIKAADRIYGVTMEKNESKILALELPEEGEAG